MSVSRPSYDQLLEENQALRVRLAEAERMLAERTAAEHRLQSVLDKLAAGVLLINADARCTFANQRAAAMFELTPAELVGKTLFEVLPSDVATAYSERNRRLIAAKAYEEYEATFELPVGTRTFFIADQVLTDERGEGEALLSSSIDITARKQAEQALHESEQKLQALFEHLPIGVSILDATGQIVFVNPALEQILDIDRELLYSGGYRSRRYLRPDGTPLSSEEFASTRARSEQRVIAQVETGIVTETGRLIWTLVSAVPVHFGDWQVILVTVDITERKRVEAALRQLNETLERRVEARTAELARANIELAHAVRLKDEFLAAMSHELRTPLNTILGRLELLQEGLDGPLTPRQVESLRRIEMSGRRLLTLIDEILNLSTIEAGRLTLERAAVDVALVCQRSRQRVSASVARKRLSLSTSLDPQVTTILADERWLTQILVSLLANAVKFTPDGGAIGLEVRGDPEQQTVSFTVWDTGIGIAEADLARLFQPFVQLDAGLNRQYEGSGLGLALVRHLTEAHQGRVSVESTPGQGSRFSVTLPWAPGQP